ncbi:Lsr2 family DNA-binding protein [Catellatospora vulcania]|uniref:Lsr2 family DNA-binding protein n=1 Tax=Catellatospora vulcania TaxID=1460450 RepID=UPI0012D3FA77|nr:histone-like nucleoid-structuring protein Lsr2 [Catellatospora vulcania]
MTGRRRRAAATPQHAEGFADGPHDDGFDHGAPDDGFEDGFDDGAPDDGFGDSDHDQDDRHGGDQDHHGSGESSGDRGSRTAGGEGGGWRGFPVAKPRLPADGIQARSRRGDVATTWWSRRFLAAIESPETASRLARGKSYARSGQVLSLTIAPGAVSATVQGSRLQPYAVTVAAPPFTPAQCGRVVAALAQQAVFSAELLAGRMPEDIEQVLSPLGLSLFPSAHQLDLECSCPDWGNPCKHAAAVCFLLAEQFDADPFTILHWRGLPRAGLLDDLRTHRAEQAGDTGAAEVYEPDELRGFWAGGPLPPPPPADPDAASRLLARLGPVGIVIGGMDFAKALAPAYEAMVRHRPDPPLPTGDPTGPSPQRPDPPVALPPDALPPDGTDGSRELPGAAEVRAWARDNGIEVNARGRLRTDVVQAYRDAHGG